MTVDITPEAVERLIRRHSNMLHPCTATTLHALSAALTTSHAETAAAYEVVANMRFIGVVGLAEFQQKTKDAIRALTPADSKAALERMLAEARAAGRNDGMREAVGILEATYRTRINLGLHSGFNALASTKEAILAAIPKRQDHE
jgi:uncharacterized NAD-dependent epimerase/dehydratase family protein